MTHTTTIIGATILGSALIVGAVFATQAPQPVEESFLSDESTIESASLAGASIDLYRSPTCGCCAGHAAALEAAGAEVTVHNLNGTELQDLKDSHNIPFDKQSCHTSIVNDYVVEGHVPVEALADFLAAAPDTQGITLPGMPIGTPGMPGPQIEPYIVETLEGEVFWRKDPS